MVKRMVQAFSWRFKQMPTYLAAMDDLECGQATTYKNRIRLSYKMRGDDIEYEVRISHF